jgi:hypothetical protein
MKPKQSAQTHHPPGKQAPSAIPPESDTEQKTWKGGGREPADPDDVGDDGEYVDMENRRRCDGAGTSDS